MIQRITIIFAMAAFMPTGLEASRRFHQEEYPAPVNEWKTRVERWATFPTVIDGQLPNECSIQRDQAYTTAADPKCYVLTTFDDRSPYNVNVYTINRRLDNDGQRHFKHQIFDREPEAQRWIRLQLSPLGCNCNCCCVQ